MARLELRAPAKINLGLRLVGRRQDGYHELESLFLPLELADRIELEVEEGGPPCVALTLEGAADGVPTGPENLAVRAARAFLEAAGLELRLRARLQKALPAGAGLGGGSSDAGAVLRGLAGLFPGSVPDLPALALRLGADVPFFLAPRPARVGGIGEVVEPVEGIPSLGVVLLLRLAAVMTPLRVFPEGVPTRRADRWTRPARRAPIARRCCAWCARAHRARSVCEKT